MDHLYKGTKNRVIFISCLSLLLQHVVSIYEHYVMSATCSENWPTPKDFILLDITCCGINVIGTNYCHRISHCLNNVVLNSFDLKKKKTFRLVFRHSESNRT